MHTIHYPSSPSQGSVLERLPTVAYRTGLSASEIYRRVASGTFPRPVKIGRHASAWSAHEIDEWINDRIAERDRPKGAS